MEKVEDKNIVEEFTVNQKEIHDVAWFILKPISWIIQFCGLIVTFNVITWIWFGWWWFWRIELTALVLVGIFLIIEQLVVRSTRELIREHKMRNEKDRLLKEEAFLKYKQQNS